jgi:hypothetical protein
MAADPMPTAGSVPEDISSWIPRGRGGPTLYESRSSLASGKEVLSDTFVKNEQESDEMRNTTIFINRKDS